MEPFYRDNSTTIYQGKNEIVLPLLPDASVDAIVTDPPYGLEFMGKAWDYDVPTVEQFAQCLRVLKPGGHMLCFAGTRTQHRMAVNIEDAGFEIRDIIAWVYGSGFPKSLDVSKAIDKAAGAEREIVGTRSKAGMGSSNTFAQDAWTQANRGPVELSITEPATDAAKQWDGWGTALKPSLEPITVARKPLEGTVANNVLTYGCGAMNIDGCRIHADDAQGGEYTVKRLAPGATINATGEWKQDVEFNGVMKPGRWPANFIHDGSDEVTSLFPHTESGQPAGIKAGGKKNCFSEFAGGIPLTGFGDSGSAARFFYCAKAAQSERGSFNHHATVKPIDLMRYLIRLVTPIGGTLLDPWGGSGSTAVAARQEHVKVVIVEQELEFCQTMLKRLGSGTLF